MVLAQTTSSTSTDSTLHSDDSSVGKSSLGPGGVRTEPPSPSQAGAGLVGWISKTLSLPTLTNITDKDTDAVAPDRKSVV